MKIEIWTEYDETYCETCGVSYAEGGKVIVDGKEVICITPWASCYDGEGASEWELLILALAKVGINVTVDGQMPHMSYTKNQDLINKLTEENA